MHLSNGTLLRGGMYQIVGFIANGGFGCTYEAIHPMLEKKIAIKEFFPKSLCNRDSDTSQVSVGTLSQKPLLDKLKKKFIQEARSIAKLSHPGIVKVSDVFEENGTAYYVMDYIEGKSLGKIIEERGPLSEKEALGYIRQICQALDYVHKQNRLHLDIKPGNIMIDDNGKAILIDFGTSKQYDEENGENTSTLVGKTPGYAPIEQMGSDVSGFKPATDIYALGATLYKCLTGKTPLESTQLANGDELAPLPSNVSASTKKAINAAMQVGSKKRPQSIEEFLSILDGTNSKTQANEETVIDAPISKTKEEPQQKISEPITIPPITPLNNSDDSSMEDEPKSSKTKLYLGIAAVVVIALICWMAFGGKESTPTNGGGEGIALVADSLNNIEHQIVDQNNLGLVSADSLQFSPDVPVSEVEDTKNSTPPTGLPSQSIDEQVAATQPEPSKIPVVTTGTIEGHEWVDLGLPSGLKWATCNVGAISSEQFGNYFAWGETKAKSSYDKENSETFGKDNEWLQSNGYIGGSGNLTLSHDAAHQNWGGTWRMPTKEEVEELINNTTTEWINFKGVNGTLVKSKKNDNSIFLPAANRRCGSSPNSSSLYGYYWCSSPYESSSMNAYNLFFTTRIFIARGLYRYEGFPVRPVSK